ncbi:hypothetical protein BDZ91DRAFT_726584 [Kalaharituber pfeilii]|nr:hypothetical protein BDZ91DRAFT_726584 [Kalaharituber pfeilii]
MRTSHTPTGLTEKYSTYRHHLTFYRCVTTATLYRPPPTDTPGAFLAPEAFKPILYYALSEAIVRHPMLSVTIKDEHTSKPYFASIDSVNLDTVVEWSPTPEASHNFDADSEIQGILNRDFKSQLQSGGPVWRVRVIFTPPQGVWLIFAFHHAIGDAISGVAFHRAVLRALNSAPQTTSDVANLIEIAAKDRRPLPPALETVHSLPLGVGYILKAVYDEYLRPDRRDDKLWMCSSSAGRARETYFPFLPPSEGGTGALKTELITLWVPGDMISALRSSCRRNRTSITALLQTVLARGLAEIGPEKLVVCGLVSMRRWLGAEITPYVPAEEADVSSGGAGTDAVMGCFVTQFKETYLGPSLAGSDGLWSESRRSKATIDRILGDQGRNTESGLLRFVADFDTFFRSKIGKRRVESLEMSNIGAVKFGGSTSEGWGVAEMKFTQSAAVTGAAVHCSVVTVEGEGQDGGMAIALTWQEGVATREEIGKVMGVVEEWLGKLAKDGQE